MIVTSGRIIWIISVLVFLLALGPTLSTGQGERVAVITVLPETVPNVVVPPAPPTYIEARGAGGTYLSIAIDPTPLYEVDGLVTPRELPGWWDKGIDSMPSTDALGTVLIAGHAQANPPAAFNPLMVAAVGDEIVLKTDVGMLKYTICEPPLLLHRELETPFREDIYAPLPGRLVLVMCNLDQGMDTFYNRFLIAQLGNCSNPVG